MSRDLVSTRCLTSWLAWCALSLGSLTAAAAEPYVALSKLVEPLTVRSLGPAIMSGRVTDLAVVESKPSTMYVASASGGVWKTVNQGTTWTPILDHAAVASIGAIAVAPSNPLVVYVGTGEANARNSVSWGDGVYRSADGGATWKHVGLAATRHIGRIVVHPRDPDIAYVAALGRLWGPNPERGLYKTIDGGASWRLVKTLDADTGCIDVALDPSDPQRVFTVTYRVRRGPFSGGNPAIQFGAQSGLYCSADAGGTWIRLTTGLPDRPFGRCGIAISRSDPRVVYAVIQTDKTDIRQVRGQRPRTNEDPSTGGIFRSADRGMSWVKVNDLCPRPFYYGQVRIDPRDPNRIYVLGISLHLSTDGGRTFLPGSAAGESHGDHHALWIDPRDPDHLVLGNDGGLYISYDRTATWQHADNLPIAQFYGIAVDNRIPYRVFGGLQDNGSWMAPTATRSPEGIINADWSRILGADGFQCQCDPLDANTVYAETQWGGLRRINLATGRRAAIWPDPPPGAPAYRFNWNSPLLLSPHNSRVIYYGGNHLFRSLNRGDDWEIISPDLTLGTPGPSADQGHTLTTIAESPLKAGVLWAGTDDGKLWVSRDHGSHWTDVSARVPGVALSRHITRIECSPFSVGTAFVALDRHRQDDEAPYLLRSDDYGDNWLALDQGLPTIGPVHVIRTDPRNSGLLFCGTEFGLFISVDQGGHWYRLHSLPPVAVHDLVLQRRERELVIATHGRGLYVLDISPLQELTPAVLRQPVALLGTKVGRPLAALKMSSPGAGNRHFAAPNPQPGATIWYFVQAEQPGPLRISVNDSLGRPVIDFPADSKPGLHSVVWDLTRQTAEGNKPSEKLPVESGDYRVTLSAGPVSLFHKLRLDTVD